MYLRREQMLRVAKEEYETVRGPGSWETDQAADAWTNERFLRFRENIIRLMARNHALVASRLDGIKDQAA